MQMNPIPTQPSVFLVNNHDSFTYNLVELLRQCEIPFQVCDVEKVDLALIEPFSHILISPGPDVPSAYPQLFEIYHKFHQSKSILGVCLGHQSLWEFFGGELKQLQAPRHGERKYCRVSAPSSLFAGLPKNFYVGLYHSWAVKEMSSDFPLDVTAQCDDKVILAYQHKSLPIYGIQFHPESIMSEFGLQIMQNWLAIK